MEVAMTRFLALALAAVLAFGTAAPAFAQSATLDKISQSGTLVIGTRTGSPPFAYVNKDNQWVGFSIDLVEQAIVPALAKKLGKEVKVEKKESTPPTRIPLLSSNAVDLIAGTMTDTRPRRDSVDFSITFFVTGAQFLVKKGARSRASRPSPASASPPSRAPRTPRSSASACPPPSSGSSRTSPRRSRPWPRDRSTRTPTTASSWPGSRPRLPSRTTG
jgi:hypothetical protein